MLAVGRRRSMSGFQPWKNRLSSAREHTLPVAFQVSDGNMNPDTQNTQSSPDYPLVPAILAVVHYRLAGLGCSASFFTLWLAISRPDHLVVDDDEYQRLKSELKAQQPEKKLTDHGRPIGTDRIRLMTKSHGSVSTAGSPFQAPANSWSMSMMRHRLSVAAVARPLPT